MIITDQRHDVAVGGLLCLYCTAVNVCVCVCVCVCVSVCEEFGVDNCDQSHDDAIGGLLCRYCIAPTVCVSGIRR